MPVSPLSHGREAGTRSGSWPPLGLPQAAQTFDGNKSPTEVGQSENPISHRDLAKILKDFDTGFNGIIAYVVLKLDMTQAEPFNVVGFAAWDEAVAKAHAQVVTARFDMVPALAVHDRIAVVWLSYGHPSGLRRLVNAWCHTERPLAAFPRLEFHVAPLRFISLVEWFAERPHSLIKQ